MLNQSLAVGWFHLELWSSGSKYEHDVTFGDYGYYENWTRGEEEATTEAY